MDRQTKAISISPHPLCGRGLINQIPTHWLPYLEDDRKDHMPLREVPNMTGDHSCHSEFWEKVSAENILNYFFLFFPENRFGHFVQIVSLLTGDNLHEMSKPIFWKKIRKNIIGVSSAKLAQGVVVVKFSRF